MQYTRLGKYLAVSRITGPQHNILQVCLAPGEQRTPVCERLPPIGSCVHEPLDEVALVAQVLAGVKEANNHLGTSHAVTHIRYVANDTKPENVYAYMSSKLVEHFAAEGVFLEPNPSSNAL